MTISIEFKKKHQNKADTMIVGVYKDNRLSATAEDINKKLGGLVSAHLKKQHLFKGKSGQTLTIPVNPDSGFARLVLLGLGESAKLDAIGCETLGGKLYSVLGSAGAEKASLLIDEDQSREKIGAAEMAAHIAMGLLLRSYEFKRYKSKPEDDDKAPELQKVEIVCDDAAKTAALFKDLNAVAQGVFLARDLMNEPPNVLYPEHYAQLIREQMLPIGVEVEIIDFKKMKKLGFHAHIAVGQGSERPPCVVIMRWNGASAPAANKGKTKDKNAPLAFVGKGVTFDTGGISIKPGAGMEEMKMDMGGSAAVCGTIKALALRKAKVNAIGIVGLAENMPSHNAYRPGDIIGSLAGKTIEVLNTDAEGRLVLVDALTYVQKTYDPRFVIDLATLTGAIMVALGHEYAGAFVNNDDLWSNLETASKETGEKLWRMPLDESYRKEMEGNLSDLQNLGSGGRYGGACSAAGFLEHFIDKGRSWAHLDIAGMMNWKKDKPTSPKGPPGFGVRLLDRLVADFYEA